MQGGITNILVKVCNSSSIRFNYKTSKAYRAINMTELHRLIDTNKDINILIIENIKQNEYESMKKFISTFRELNSINRVFFYVQDNDDTTCGLADELDYDILLNLDSLHRVINNSFKVNIGTSLTVKETIKAEELVSKDIDFDDSFDNSFGNIDDTVTVEEEPIEEPIEEEKASIEEPIEEEKAYIEEPIEEEKASIEEPIEEEKASIEEPIEEEKASIEEPVEEKASIEEPKHIDKEETTVIIEESSNSLIGGVKDVGITEVRYDNISEDLDMCNDKITELNKVISALEDENNINKSTLETIQNSETIIEEPISLIDYKGLLEDIEGLKGRYSKLESINGDLDSELSEIRLEHSKTQQYKEKLEVEIQRLELICYDLDKQVSAVDSNTQGELEVAKAKVAELNKSNDRLSRDNDELIKSKGLIETELGELRTKIQEYEESIGKYKENIDTEVKAKIEITEQLNTALNNVSSLESLNVDKDKDIRQLSDEIRQLEDIKKKLEENISSLTADIDTLGNKVRQVDEIIETTKSESSVEIGTLVGEKVQIQSKLDIANAQLVAKEYQYNNLIKQLGGDEENVLSIIESNKTLEVVNKSLKVQLKTVSSELTKVKRERKTAIQNIKQIEGYTKELESSLNAVVTGIKVGGGIKINSCKYNSRGKIIPVFGSGSVGVTTTAMSLASKLSCESKVVYIDFDMVMPKADSWFKVNPIVKGITGIDKTSVTSTGLGLFIGMQLQFFISYASNIIKNVSSTAGGCLDYISGIYSRPDTVKLISADYSSFFNYLGSLYEYIIVDFGTLGSSDLGDALVKIISDVAYRNIVVTTNDKFEVRNFNMRLSESAIDKGNVAWLLNMCDSTIVEQGLRSSINPSGIGIVPFDNSIRGKRLDFTKCSITKDKFNSFIDKDVSK